MDRGPRYIGRHRARMHLADLVELAKYKFPLQRLGAHIGNQEPKSQSRFRRNTITIGLSILVGLLVGFATYYTIR